MKLPEHQRLLAFDRYWAGYDLDGSVPEEAEKMVHYAPAHASVQEKLKEIARNAYLALKGSGYGRVDMRSDSYDLASMKVYVLEVNANCGLSFDDSSSMGEVR